jgi:methyltransferase (TIGR00027 family)
MGFIAFLVFVVVQIVFIPFAIIGVIMVTYNQLLVSRRLGVSSTALSAMGQRWIMHAFGIRKDPATVALYRALPVGSEMGVWFLLFPSILRHRLHPTITEEGKETLTNAIMARTLHIDKLIKNSKDAVEQAVVMGAGYDTRCYGDLKKNNLKCFELDQEKIQDLKKKSLAMAGIDASHVTFVGVNFAAEKWYEKLERAGFDPKKKTLFLLEGVTLYLSEDDVRKTIREIKDHAAPGSVLVADFGSNRLLKLRGVKATKEKFTFGLDLSTEREKVLRTFIESEHVKPGSVYFIGHKTKPGTLLAVAEIVL